MEFPPGPSQDAAPLCPPPSSDRPWPGLPEVEPHEPRNLVVLAAHQVVYCVGWIFKTESVIMPAFLGAVAGPGSGWLRGFMPVLNRFGQSVPQIFLAGRLRAMPVKKRAMAAFAALMALPLLGMAGAWWATAGRPCAWAPALVLTLYLAFFVFNGLYLLSYGTVQGKLIRPTHRGRLLRRATFWGTVTATLFAVWLLPGWLRADGTAGPRYDAIFTWVAACLGLSALVALLVREPPEQNGPALDRRRLGNLRDMARALRADPNLRMVGLVAMLLGSGLVVAPHYQALALEKFKLPPGKLLIFAVTQNAAVGAFSLLVGPMADAWGNRLTLRLMIFGAAGAPALAAGLAWFPGEAGAALAWLVFVPLGISPLLLPILNNYTLETCAPNRHPRYLSTVNLCVAVPYLLSPAAGWAVDRLGYAPVFSVTAALLLLSGAATFLVSEPRRRAGGPSDASGQQTPVSKLPKS